MSRYLKTEELAPANLKNEVEDDDDWDTDVDQINNVSEKEQRWGSTLIVPPKEHFSIHDVRKDVIETHETVHVGPKHSSQKHQYGEQE